MGYRAAGHGGTDANDLEGVMLGTYLAGLEVDVLEGIELVEDNIDIIRADAMTQGGDALALVGAGDREELARRDLTLAAIEERGYHIYTAWIATHHNLVGQLLGTKVKVEAAAIGINYQFAGCYHKY